MVDRWMAPDAEVSLAKIESDLSALCFLMFIVAVAAIVGTIFMIHKW